MLDTISRFSHDSPMSIVRRKPGFPVPCPRCDKLSGWPNGIITRVTRGKVQQVRCAGCNYQWALRRDDLAWLFGGQRVHVRLELLLKALACVVLGLPMSASEKLLGIKAETIKTKLVSLLQADRWEMLDGLLEKRFGIPQFDRGEFHDEIVVGREWDPAAFRCWSKKFRRLTPAERAKLLRRIARIVGCPLRAVLRAVRIRK
jgi:transposase-like protein